MFLFNAPEFDSLLEVSKSRLVVVSLAEFLAGQGPASVSCCLHTPGTLPLTSSSPMAAAARAGGRVHAVVGALSLGLCMLLTLYYTENESQP